MTSTDSSYTAGFNSFISLNDRLPPSFIHRGRGTCYSHYNPVGSSGVSILNCNAVRSYYTDYFLIVGRYVTIMSRDPSSYASVMTVCEVTVTGVRQNISADGNFSLLIWNEMQHDSKYKSNADLFDCHKHYFANYCKADRHRAEAMSSQWRHNLLLPVRPIAGRELGTMLKLVALRQTVPAVLYRFTTTQVLEAGAPEGP